MDAGGLVKNRKPVQSFVPFFALIRILDKTEFVRDNPFLGGCSTVS